MRKILIFYNYFRPARNAGGIVRSLENLVELLADNYKIFIFTSAYDLGVDKPLPGLTCNQWIPYSKNTEVYYSSARWGLFFVMKKEIERISPNVCYINGIFSPGYVLMPLFIFRLFSHNMLFVVAPRGMVQAGALQVKWFKKAVYLRLFRVLQLQTNIRWHATDAQELTDIQTQFGAKSDVVFALVALDTPSITSPVLNILRKPKKEIKLVYLSLITEKKNLLFLLQIFRQVSKDIKITFDVYGPVKDAKYWSLCLEEANKLKANVVFSYCGLADPDHVIETIQKYHFFILPSKGENFGHAIYESLLAGRPVMISDKTPWTNLNEKKAGLVFSLSETEIKAAIEMAAEMDEETYVEYCHGARGAARLYLKENDFLRQYLNLFKS